jgi:hypothetical protein
MTWLGYVLAGTTYAFYFTVFAFKPNGFLGPDSVFVVSVLGAAVTGLIYLPLPMLASFALNGEIRGTAKSLWLRSLLLGILLCSLINAWPEDQNNTHESHFVRGIFIFLAVFILPLFMLARRAERNLLHDDGQPYSDQGDGAQQTIPADRPKTGSG